MASVMIGTYPITTEIDYSLVDGRIRGFVLRGQKLYDEQDGTDVSGWRDKLVKLVRQYDLDTDRDGRGLHAFVYRMQDDGLLPKTAG